MDRWPSSRPYALDPAPPRRWLWPLAAGLAGLVLAAAFVFGSRSGDSEARAWVLSHPCFLAPGGAVTVRTASGGGTLYTCSRDGEVMSRIPWAGEVAP